MKKILLITLVAAFVLSSCTEESAGVSKVTTYASMSLNGKAEMFWPIGTAFADPGCVALEGANDISTKITSNVSDVNVNKGGNYTINYQVLNADGFAASATRLVHVYDATAPLNGYYASKIKRSNNGVLGNRGPYTMLVFGVGSNKYYVQDLLGGWYFIGSGYGVTYSGPAILQLNGDNTFTIVSASKLAWGYPCLFTAPSTYDASTKTLVLNTRMEDVATMLFTVTLNNPTPLN
jgi:hypothetical protein